jgi:hypothetical protein
MVHAEVAPLAGAGVAGVQVAVVDDGERFGASAARSAASMSGRETLTASPARAGGGQVPGASVGAPRPSGSARCRSPARP